MVVALISNTGVATNSIIFFPNSKGNLNWHCTLEAILDNF